MRVAGDLGGDYGLAQRGGLVNATAIALFLAVTVGTAAHGRLQKRTQRAPSGRAAYVPARDGR
jgi:hypothetical protein